jgi:hypothetical protein
MKNNFPITIFKEIIQIFRTVFQNDKILMGAFEYDSKGSFQSKFAACHFALASIKAEDCVYPGQKKYRNVKNFFMKNDFSRLGHWGDFNMQSQQWVQRELTNSFHSSWANFIYFCMGMKKYLPQSEPEFVEFGIWLEQEYNELKHLGLI